MEDRRVANWNTRTMDHFEAKRQTKARKQRAFRNKVKNFLCTRARDLEGELKRLQKNQVTLLPWNEVEKALRNDLIESQKTNFHLCANIRNMHAQKYAMTQWLKTVLNPVPQRAPSQYPVWNNKNYLPLGHIAHVPHTDNVLQLAGFHPSNKQLYQDFILDKSKEHIEYVYRDRRIYTSTLDKAVKAFRNLYHTQVEDDTALKQEIFDATMLKKDNVCSRMCEYNLSLVHREFVTD
ncbi:hypothetical protein THRCLA_11482 [Thraustotheca clavata]|uniref:Uncharacterized protein n=1 Tax=Thraustotheca clavata TaxID=74557 RepID=A0A1V9Y7K3_9STRA|nr:hypothetical protein THRCLA_11482 [Thraustotheca clavata]